MGVVMAISSGVIVREVSERSAIGMSTPPQFWGVD